MMRPPRIAMLVTLATATLAACSASTTAAESDEGKPLEEGGPGGRSDAGTSSGPTQDGAAGAEPVGSRYHAFLAQGTCSDVNGNGGTWTSRSAFPEAPAAIRDVACTYDWTSSTRAVPDLAALRALGPELLTRSVDEAPDFRPPVSLEVVPVIVDGGSDSAPTGVTGCDVCGRVLERQAFVILPDDELQLRTIIVTTDTGRFLSFEVQQPPTSGGKAQVFSVTLPPALEGEYEDGRIILVEKAF